MLQKEIHAVSERPAVKRTVVPPAAKKVLKAGGKVNLAPSPPGKLAGVLRAEPENVFLRHQHAFQSTVGCTVGKELVKREAVVKMRTAPFGFLQESQAGVAIKQPSPAAANN